MSELPSLVAFAGSAAVGKDEAAKALIARGYTRSAFGDLIKADLDEVIQRHFGFSAFTEDREEKAQIRRTLESWGEDSYGRILTTYMANLKPPAVNTRLVRLEEAREWKKCGGVLIEVTRPGYKPVTVWEGNRLYELRTSGLIDAVIDNDGTPDDLWDKLLCGLTYLSEQKAGSSLSDQH